MAESEAKASSIERRLERFLSNPRIDVEETWDELLAQVMPFFREEPIRLIIDVTPYEEHAQVIYVGLLQHSRVLPLVWKVMPGQQKWDPRVLGVHRRTLRATGPTCWECGVHDHRR